MAYGISKVTGFDLTRKISSHVAVIKKGKIQELKLGNLEAKRDWGHAKEYVKAMWKMLQQEQPNDFIISTGKTIILGEFAKLTFDYLELEMDNHIIIDKGLIRPSDIVFSKGNPSKSNEILKWKAKTNVEELIRIMIQSELGNT